MSNVRTLKQRVDLRRLLDEHYGLLFGYSDTKANGLCPFPDHDDTRPSFVIWLTGDFKGYFKCSCGQGDIVEFVKRMEHCDFNSAVKLLERFVAGRSPHDQHSIDISLLKQTLQEATDPKPIAAASTPPPLPACRRTFMPIANYMHWRRRYTPQQSDKIIRAFGLMWCVDPRRYPGRDGELVMSFNNTIVVPIFNAEGQYRSFQAQIVTKPVPKLNKLFPAGEGILKDALIGIQQAKTMAAKQNHRWCVLVEGFWDVARLWSYEVPAVGAIMSRITPHQAYALIRNFDTVYLGFDTDPPYLDPNGVVRLGAGEEACRKAHARLNGVVELKRMVIPPGMDPDEMTGDEVVDAIDNAVMYAPPRG